MPGCLAHLHPADGACLVIDHPGQSRERGMRPGRTPGETARGLRGGGRAGSLLCALFASVLTTVAATDRVGPFERLSRVEVMMKLQAFNGAMALTALILSAVITEQIYTRRSVERACQELVEVLEHLTAGEVADGRASAEDGGHGRRQEE